MVREIRAAAGSMKLLNDRNTPEGSAFCRTSSMVEQLPCLSNLNEYKNMDLTPKQKGNLTELQVITYLYSLGYQCSLPYGENSRYDLIADINGNLLKIQVKTSSIKNNNSDAIEFSCRSTRINSSGTVSNKYTKEQIDYFATFWNNQCYLVPVEECSISKTLRFCYPSNGQKKGISLAENYTAEKQLQKYQKEEVI